jgi:L-asparaginase
VTSLPRIRLLAFGGTIASVASPDGASVEPTLVAAQIVESVPQIAAVAQLELRDFAAVGSYEVTPVHMLALAREVEQARAGGSDGVVLTHGTDTIEETAYFLNLVVKSKKPVVLTAAMRPATALSADGPLNFYNAVAVASNKDAGGRGVLVVINDWIHGAASLTKTSTTAVQTFMSPLSGLIGTIAYGKAEFNRAPIGKHTADTEFSLQGVTALPRVDIIMAYENMDGALIDAAAAAGAKGIVIAGVGNGNLTKAAVDALATQAKRGLVCVRASRVAVGRVDRNVELDDDKLGFVASLDKNPQKSRVLLRLALLKSSNPNDVQRMFRDY